MPTATTRPGPLTAIAALLACLVALGAMAYTRQLTVGLQITGLSRGAPWGLYIGQLTFLVGVAASAVMVVLPYALHHETAFAKLTVLGELLSICALVMAMLFVLVDMGQPARLLNVLLHPTPGSLMFWDLLVVSSYLVVNIVLVGSTLRTARTAHQAAQAPVWYRPLVYVSIPLAFGIHTVTALLFSGLAARPGWMTAILAPRFLASAFASGPALLILLGVWLRRTHRFDVGSEAISKLAMIATYALVANVFFAALEAFTAEYSGISEHAEHFQYLFAGLHGHHALVPWMWASGLLSLGALAVLLAPNARSSQGRLVLACVATIVSVWIDKGLCLIVSGFVPTAAGDILDYRPTLPELAITAAIYAAGALMFGGLCRVCLRILSSPAHGAGCAPQVSFASSDAK
ncbi:MAG: polysulfide reductase NrfD [Polyangiaceae bacterium]|nr:polysulfide reductase NrfD [Polyangiaceae bacterium]